MWASFAMNGMSSFPDTVDRQTPLFGYMYGHMPWKIGEALSGVGITTLNKKITGGGVGITTLNKKITGACHVDRKLISGDSPLAANEFGKLAIVVLLKEIY